MSPQMLLKIDSNIHSINNIQKPKSDKLLDYDSALISGKREKTFCLFYFGT
jgi:hypothetical protein